MYKLRWSAYDYYREADTHFELQGPAAAVLDLYYRLDARTVHDWNVRIFTPADEPITALDLHLQLQTAQVAVAGGGDHA